MFELIGWFVFILSIITGLIVIAAVFVGIHSANYIISDIFSDQKKYSCPNCKAHCRMIKNQNRFFGWNPIEYDLKCPHCGHLFDI